MRMNEFVSPLLTDKYQLTMVYAYWKAGRHEKRATFDLFFRKCPFGGEFAIFAGLADIICLLEDFHFKDERLDIVRRIIPDCEPDFYQWLSTLDSSDMSITAIPEGSVVFPRVPLLTVHGPLAVAQLFETPLLNLVNFPTLIATNAARFRLAAGPDSKAVEFGLRRAQGPDGAMSAARYAYLGGFDGTSNVLASALYDIPCFGTHAHSYVQSFTGLEDLNDSGLVDAQGQRRDDFVQLVLEHRRQLGFTETNEGELAAFISYAQAHPKEFLALVDTYDTLRSGVPNFICVARALREFGYQPLGIRLDSGDLAYLSKEARQLCFKHFPPGDITIVASNDINEEVLAALNQEGHQINTFGIGTHLVTCQAQPALGAVYKLVEINGVPRVKVSRDAALEKVTIPGRKIVYRLWDDNLIPLADLMTLVSEPAPGKDIPVTCWHPFDQLKRAEFIPAFITPLHETVWDGGRNDSYDSSLKAVRERALCQLQQMRGDHLRRLHPTPYKVSVSPELYEQMHELIAREMVA